MALFKLNTITRLLSQWPMKRTTVIIPWKEGLHLRPAARLVKLSQKFRSSIRLVCGAGIADTRSIFSIMALCAVMGTHLDLEANGDDEQEAIQALEAEFFPGLDDPML